MVNLIYTPQRADFKVEYITNNDVLTVKIDDVLETFDFTGLEDGIAEGIIVEVLPINPIIKVEKIGGTLDIIVVKFYNEDEKHLFEVIENE